MIKKTNLLILGILVLFSSFLIVITVSFIVFNENYLSFSNNLDNMLLDLETTQIELDYYSSNNNFKCDNSSLLSFQNSLNDLRLALVELEENEEINNEKYKILKKSYNVNQLQYLTIIKDFNIKCEDNIPNMLYFFNSSNTQNSQEFEKFLSKQNDTVIFALDYGAFESLKEFYELYNYTPPFIVSNEKILFLEDIK